MSSGPLWVVKLGGSLLELEDLPARLRNWRARQVSAAMLLVVGGGRGADGIRELDSRFQLGEATSHEACLHVLEANARAVAGLFPEARLVGSPEKLKSHLPQAENGLWIARPRRWLRKISAPLPSCWSVTSDSIAAHFARELGAEQLVLLKSADPPQPANPHAWAAAGYVDAYFPQAAAGLRIEAVNLRSEQALPLGSASLPT